jgi:type VI secretion system protein ImpK
MPDALRNTPAPAVNRTAAPGTERLAMFYEGILTAILRIQSGREQLHHPEGFRNRIKDALKDISDAAARRGYPANIVREANFAVVAFLDEVVLSTQNPGQTHWARKNLQEELFDQRSAGELFFKHLDELRARQDSIELAEALEVYYLCLLLGYEGRYASGSKAELHIMMDNVREKIERILGTQSDFSPDWRLPDDAPAAAAPDPYFQRLRVAAVAALALALLCFAGFSWSLNSRTATLEHQAELRAER